MVTARRVAWGLAGWGFVLLAFAVLLRLMRQPDVLGVLGSVVAAGAITIVGAVVASHQPRNPIGWSFLAAGVTFAYADFALEYARRAIVAQPGSLPLGVWVAWTGTWIAPLAIWIPILLIPYLFPTGRALSTRWLPGLFVGLFGLVAVNLGNAFGHEIGADDLGHVHNPASWPAFEAALQKIGNALWTLPFVSLAIGALCIIVRYRRSRGIERQQLKWIVVSGVFVLAGTAGLFLSQAARIAFLARVPVFGVLIGIGLGSLPLTVSIAILRYRLYDVDRIIRRTVSYLIVTALLASLYAFVALTPSLAFRTHEIPNALVAIGTLAAAMAFVPVRRRVQTIVDRRFNRSRFDAAQTIERFGSRLRLEVDLDAMVNELRSVVDATMQPSSVGIWLSRR